MELAKMETTQHYDDKVRVLYEASYTGCVSTLNSLIQQDPLILYKISSQTVFIETPLHVSASLGHFEFTKALLTHKPQLAVELDSFRSTALHLTSAEGHVDIVKELLVAYDQACLIADQEGRIPLHYAVIRGRIEVVREQVRAKPECLRIIDVKGKTVFHLCVAYNHLDILKALVESDIDNTSELLNSRDLDGKNTVFHLAIMLKQVETVRYLLSIPKVKEGSNLENGMGFTAHDFVEQIPRDLKSLEIQVMLMNIDGMKIEKKGADTLPQPRPPPSSTTDAVSEAVRPHEKWWRQVLKKMETWFEFEHKGDWFEEMRGNLSLVATVISTITFQVINNPPGGFIQQSIDSHKPLDCLTLQDGDVCPGEALLASANSGDFFYFIIFNTTSFVASLAVTLLLVSGVPLENKLMVWMLSIGMCITLTSLALTYFNGLSLMTPDGLWDSTSKVSKISIRFWVGLLGLIGLYIAIRFAIWLAKKCMKINTHHMSMCRRNGSGSCFI